MRLRWIIAPAVAAALCAGVLAVPGCKKKGTNAAKVVLGEYASLNGSTADFGTSSHEGLQLAVKQANDNGGVLGKPVELVTVDDRSDVNEAQTAVDRLINHDEALAVIGEVASKRSLAGGSLCQRYKTPMLSPASTNPDVTVEGGKVKDFVFRICFTDDFQGMIDGKFAAEQGWKRVAVLTNRDEDYSKGLSKSFKKAFTAGGGQVVQDLEYTGSLDKFQSLLSLVKEANPDAVYVPGYYGEVTQMLPQARKELELNVPFFGGDGWDSPTTRALPEAQGCFYTDHYSSDDPDPRVQQFVKAYKAATGKAPDAMAALGYDAGGVMLKAVQAAGKTDRQAVRDALAQIKDYPGVTGTITIDANHNARKSIVVLRLNNGKAELYKTYDADGNPVGPAKANPPAAPASETPASRPSSRPASLPAAP